MSIGFHWRDGWTFLRLADGSVRVRRHVDARCSEIAEEKIVPPNEWASIIASVTRYGETVTSYRAAEVLHNAGCP